MVGCGPVLRLRGVPWRLILSFISMLRLFIVSLCSSSVLPFLSWQRLSSYHGSDHYPVLLAEVSHEASPAPRPPWWSYERAD